MPYAIEYLGVTGMSWFEIGMLACFGVSWPFSIRKMLIAKSSEGKSFIFLTLLLIGYLCGICHKVAYHCDVVVFLYTLNFLMVLADTLLCYRLRTSGFRLQKQSRKPDTMLEHQNPKPEV